jgi:hypothetical protein
LSAAGPAVLLFALLAAAAPASAGEAPAPQSDKSDKPDRSDKSDKSDKSHKPLPVPAFRDVTRQAGVTFEHHSAPEKKYILESMSGGVALFDFDGDDLLDIYLVNSLTVETVGAPESAPSALYRNLGDGTFVDVAAKAGVAHPGWGMGVCTADVDGDGRPDLYVTAVGGNRLYLNDGGVDGRVTFTDVAGEAGVAAGGWSAGCGFADYDRDGDLDLFVSRYVEIDLASLPKFGEGKTCQYRGIAVQCGPRGLPGTGDLLYRNDGGGADGRVTFTEVGEKAGVADPDGYFGLGVAWFDANHDGWLDLFVANDSNPNFLYLNQKDGTFVEDAFPMGVGVSEDGAEQGGMGVAVGDYRNEGRFSLFVTNFSEEYNALYHNEGDYFIDVSFRSVTAPKSLPYVGWGTAFFDYDNDGWLDLVVVNGHVYPQLDDAKLGASAPYRQPRLLYRNQRDGTFEEVAAEIGDVMTAERVSRGLALGDLDNDGRLDLVVNDLDGYAQVLRNETSGAGNWLLVSLAGSGRNTCAIGAEVTVRSAGLVQKRVVRSGTGYLSQDDLRQHFGLGEAAAADAVEVRWPDGTTSLREKVPANQVLLVRQNEKD